jgi:hypothetical protein
LLWSGGREELALCGKLELARKLVTRIAELRAGTTRAATGNVVGVQR